MRPTRIKTMSPKKSTASGLKKYAKSKLNKICNEVIPISY